MAAGSGGALPSAGTHDTRVDRPEEGLPGIATTDNPDADPITRATFDAGKPSVRVSRAAAQIDTTGTSRLTADADIKRGDPSSW
jgi:hypothetical protein